MSWFLSSLTNEWTWRGWICPPYTGSTMLMPAVTLPKRINNEDGLWIPGSDIGPRPPA